MGDQQARLPVAPGRGEPDADTVGGAARQRRELLAAVDEQVRLDGALEAKRAALA